MPGNYGNRFSRQREDGLKQLGCGQNYAAGARYLGCLTSPTPTWLIQTWLIQTWLIQIRLIQIWLTQRNNEVRAFAGFAAGDTLIGDDDRLAGRDGLVDFRHDFCRQVEAVQ